MMGGVIPEAGSPYPRHPSKRAAEARREATQGTLCSRWVANIHAYKKTSVAWLEGDLHAWTWIIA